jgi:hypothetical protein
MTDLLSVLDTLKRPRLLISAARIGAGQYRRDLHLSRHLDTSALPDSATALAELIDVEAELDAARRARRADYAVARHVDVLIAIMGEARLIRAAAAPKAEAPAQACEPAPVG